jgi:hypothetical protein
VSPEELRLWFAAVAAYTVAFGPVNVAVEKAAEIVQAFRDLKPGDLSQDAAMFLLQARGGR